jgi:hypothetical protein
MNVEGPQETTTAIRCAVADRSNDTFQFAIRKTFPPLEQIVQHLSTSARDRPVFRGYGRARMRRRPPISYPQSPELAHLIGLGLKE